LGANLALRLRILGGTEAMNATVSDFLCLLLRLWLGGLMLFVHGWPKLAAPAEFIAHGAHEFPLPAWSGWFAILAECVGGACLMAGFRTRLCAGAIALVMLASAWAAHDASAWGDGRELRLTLVLLALFFAVQGGGPLSLDARIARHARRRSPW
jgi:putative oxidoreductase